MARLIVSENISIDGVIQDPTGDGGLASGGWFNQVTEHDREAWAELETAEAMRAEALLMGRGTYEYFAPRWESRAGAWADRLAALPKYVVTSGRPALTWANTMLLTGDAVPAMVAKLKQDVAGELVVNGSVQLAHALLRHHLVDELRLIVFPSTAGAGARLFDAGPAGRWRLTENRTIGENLTYTSYVGAAEGD